MEIFEKDQETSLFSQNLAKNISIKVCSLIEKEEKEFKPKRRVLLTINNINSFTKISLNKRKNSFSKEDNENNFLQAKKIKHDNPFQSFLGAVKIKFKSTTPNISDKENVL